MSVVANLSVCLSWGLFPNKTHSLLLLLLQNRACTLELQSVFIAFSEVLFTTPNVLEKLMQCAQNTKLIYLNTKEHLCYNFLYPYLCAR